MRVLTPEIDIAYDKTTTLKAGVSYVVEPRAAGALLMRLDGLASVRDASYLRIIVRLTITERL